MRLGAVVVLLAACQAGGAERALTPPPPVIVAPAPTLAIPTIRVHVDVSLGNAPEVIAGIRAWERATIGWRLWELAPPGRAHLWIVEVSDPHEYCTDPGYPIAGCASAIGGLDDDQAPRARIYLVRGSYESAARMVVIHEIGHSLGLTHQDGTVMQQHPTALQWDATWHCPDEMTLLRLAWRTGHQFYCQM
jgi:hypothetical protein